MYLASTILEKGKYRVRAILDEFSDGPDYQGYPDVVIDRDTGDIHMSYKDSVNKAALKKAYDAFNEDTFMRWVRIFADDLVNRKASGIEGETNPIRADISIQNGYSQGYCWIQISFTPADSDPDTDYVSEVLYWLRGDCYYLSAQKLVTWTPDDPEEEPYTSWEKTGSFIGGFYTDKPADEAYVREAAEDLLREVIPATL